MKWEEIVVLVLDCRGLGCIEVGMKGDEGVIEED